MDSDLESMLCACSELAAWPDFANGTKHANGCVYIRAQALITKREKALLEGLAMHRWDAGPGKERFVLWKDIQSAINNLTQEKQGPKP